MVRLLFIAIGCALHAPLEGGRVMLLAARESFIRRKAEDVIPKQYRRVKYILKNTNSGGGSDLTMYPTGIYNSAAWELETVARLTGSYTKWFLFGAYYSSSFWTGYGFCGNYGESSRPAHGDKYGALFSSNGHPFVDGDNVFKCTCNASSCRVVWNGVGTTASSTRGFNNQEIFLMGNGVSHSVPYNHGMGETTIKQGGEEVAHLWPCVRLADGAHVFWDSIQRVAREKVGSGTTKVVELS